MQSTSGGGGQVSEKKKLTDSIIFKAGISILAGVIIYLLPVPQVLEHDPRAWRLLAIFVGTIVALIANPAPMGTIAIIAITLTVVSQTLSMGVALSGFSNAVIWLIVCAFFISRGFIKTGLGERIAYMFMAKLGKKTLGLAYSLIFADMVMAPTMPSNTARAGGVIFPIVRSLANAFNSKTEDGTQRKVGSYLSKTLFQADNVLCAMFMTAMAANPLAVEIAGSLGVEITWVSWAIAALVPGLVCLLIIPVALYKIYPPGIKETPQAAEIAKKRLDEIGPVTKQEKLMIFVFFLILLLWIFGPDLFGIGATATAFIGLSTMLITNVLTFEDVKSEKGAWDTLVWFAALVMMATQLNTLGVIAWFSDTVAQAVYGVNWVAAFILIAVAYFYSHYFFASATAHVSAMYGGLLAVAIAVGTPPMLAALVLAYFSSLYMGLTHYATGSAPVIYGPGYVTMGEWWGFGFLFSVINIVVWLVVGGLWWRLLGLW
ncbi:MAG: anion permease [Spirochaetes bacterium]|nr:anion permease [Spirochaetota bacterium]